jgi:hypothetical protein
VDFFAADERFVLPFGRWRCILWLRFRNRLSIELASVFL